MHFRQPLLIIDILLLKRRALMNMIIIAPEHFHVDKDRLHEADYFFEKSAT